MNTTSSYHAEHTRLRAQLRAGVGADSRMTKEDKLWAAVEGIALILDGALCTVGITEAPCAAIAGDGLSGLNELVRGGSDPNSIPNPWFVWNGHADAPSPNTKNYRKRRARKSLGSGVLGLASAGLSILTQVDVGGIAGHSSALSSTLCHLERLRMLAKQYPGTGTVAEWFGTVIRMKQFKAGVRTVSLTGASVPVALVGATTGVLAAAARSRAKVTMTKLCVATAADLHWRAFQELSIGSTFPGENGAGVGPAQMIVKELVTRRAARGRFHSYDVEAIIREPEGWRVIADKLMSS